MIGVLGATGRVGSLVAADLAARGAEACAIVRSASPAAALPQRVADLRDEDGVTAALRGVDRLLLLTPNSAEQPLLEATALQAALRARVTHIVKISGGAATLGPNGISATGQAHWRSEQAIEASGIGYTFLRPSVYAQGLLETLAPLAAKFGVLPSPFGRAPIALLDVRDLAACAVAALLDPPSEQVAWNVTGPRAITIREVGAALGLRTLPVPPAAAGRALRRQGQGPHEVDHAVRMARYLAAGGAAAVSDAVPRLTGQPARPIEPLLDALRPHFAPAQPAARTVSVLLRKGQVAW